MKKLWFVFVLSICLVLVFSMSALAGTNSVTAYIDAYGLGTWTRGSDINVDDDGSLNGIFVGADISIHKFKLGFEYEDSSPQKGDSFIMYDYTTSILKSGFQVCGKDKIKVDLTLSHYEKEVAVSKATVSGILVGVDGLWNINNRMFLQGSLGMSLNGKYELNSDDEDALIMVEKVKFNYMFTDNFGMGFGFRFNSILLESDYDDLVLDTGGLTIGATVRF